RSGHRSGSPTVSSARSRQTPRPKRLQPARPRPRKLGRGPGRLLGPGEGGDSMTTGPRSQCDTCVHYRSPFSPEGIKQDRDRSFCAAFPDGIPVAVFHNGADHRQPIEGDHGIRWESNGEPFPEYAFRPGEYRDYDADLSLDFSDEWFGPTTT